MLMIYQVYVWYNVSIFVQRAVFDKSGDKLHESRITIGIVGL